MGSDLNAAPKPVVMRIDDYLVGLAASTSKILIALAIIVVTWGVSRLTGSLEGRLARRMHLRQNISQMCC